MTSNTIISYFLSCLCVNWSHFADRTYSSILGLSDRGSIFMAGILRRREFLPRSRRSRIGGSDLIVGTFCRQNFLPRSWHSQIGGSIFSRRRDFLPRSPRSQIGGVTSQLGLFATGLPRPISALSDRGSIFTVGIFRFFA